MVKIYLYNFLTLLIKVWVERILTYLILSVYFLNVEHLHTIVFFFLFPNIIWKKIALSDMTTVLTFRIYFKKNFSFQ